MLVQGNLQEPKCEILCPQAPAGATDRTLPGVVPVQAQPDPSDDSSLFPHPWPFSRLGIAIPGERVEGMRDCRAG